MKRSILIILIFLMAVPLSHSQLWKMRRWEASAGAGPTFFFGDIGGFSQTKNILGFRDLTYLQTRFNINGNIKYRITRNINARVSMSYALFHATDERGSNETRILESTTSAFEPAILGEYYFVKNYAENSYLFLRRKSGFMRHFFNSLDFYAFTGIGAISYSVQPNEALLERGMRTGGFAAAIPAGIGGTLIFSPDLNFGLELGGRYAFTDYLDGYTSQFSKANDVYYFLNLTVTYKLRTGPNGLPRFGR
ncbi:MAG: hypothetical protein JXR66_12055 [Bacteroidales bacterium]|nr:hypothetical protein [Bacteroidales bacterium]MBN2634285.1 hypothetical protein [Bacteroidales bacterium]